MESPSLEMISSHYKINAPIFFTTPTISDAPKINFLFTCLCTNSVYRSRRQNSLIRERTYLKQGNVSISLDEFRRYPETYPLIREKIEHLPVIHGQVYDQMIDSAHMEAEKALASVPASDAHVFVQCRLIVCHDMALRRPTPPDDQSPEMKEVSSGNCCICLEDFKELGMLMPCQHIFHRDCIEKWLRVNRSCPICRFQMLPNVNNI